MSPKTPLLLLSVLLTITTINSSPISPSDLLSELQSLQSRSPSGVIHLTDSLLSRLLSSPLPRPFSLLIFFDASQLRNKPDLHLPHLHSQFSLLSKSFLSHNPQNPNHLFFCDIEFQESQHSFSLFSVNSLPHIRLLPPSLSPENSLPMDQSHFSRGADSMSEFVEHHTGLEVGPILHPPPVSRRQILFFVAALLISAPFVIPKVLSGDTLLHDWRLWMGVSLFVYFFGVSGSMHNIIRHSPMFLQDRNDPNKLVFFYQGSGMQLGAEGFAVGMLYMVVGVLIAFVTHGLVRVRNVAVQRGIMLVGMLVGYWAVAKVIALDNWKTGYGIHAFWPRSWM